MVDQEQKNAEFTGGDVNYYIVDIVDPKRLKPYKAEAEDIIEALGMTFAEGCAFKAIWRSCAMRTLGLRKKGQDDAGVYDAEKTEYYGSRMVAVRKRLAAKIVTGKNRSQLPPSPAPGYPPAPCLPPALDLTPTEEWRPS